MNWYLYILYIFQSVDTKQSNHLVFEIRQAIKFVMSDLKHSEFLPGFCIPKVNKIFLKMLYLSINTNICSIFNFCTYRMYGLKVNIIQSNKKIM